MCHTSSSVQSLTRILDLRLGEDAEQSLRDFDRREIEAVVRHLLGDPVPRLDAP